MVNRCPSSIPTTSHKLPATQAIEKWGGARKACGSSAATICISAESSWRIYLLEKTKVRQQPPRRLWQGQHGHGSEPQSFQICQVAFRWQERQQLLEDPDPLQVSKSRFPKTQPRVFSSIAWWFLPAVSCPPTNSFLLKLGRSGFSPLQLKPDQNVAFVVFFKSRSTSSFKEKGTNQNPEISVMFLTGWMTWDKVLINVYWAPVFSSRK